MTLFDEIQNLPLSDITQRVKEAQKQAGNLADLNIAVLRNVTLEPIQPFLEYLAYQENRNPHFYFGNYDNMLRDVMDSQSPLYQFKPHLILIYLDLEIASEKLTSKFYSASAEEIRTESARIVSFIETILEGLRKNSQAPVLFHGFEVPPSNSFGILDHQRTDLKVHTLRSLNRGLLEILHRFEGVYLVDLELIQARVGQKAFSDRRLWHLSQCPLGREGLRQLSVEHFKFIRALTGKNKKCLVLDCDNTLWGGVVGEEGLNRIQIGKGHPGSAFKEFQQAILDLYQRGIMLCLCSKNDPAAVQEVLDQHPDMVLRCEHFVKIKANWNDKAQNIKEIASELNIGLDSLVFIDDSEFETSLVRKFLPEVTALTLPPDATLYANWLRSCGLFDTLTYSSEDRARSEMYKAEEKRGEVQKKFTDIREYLRYLEMEVEITSADEFSLQRIFQLVQKTNQFNLTTKRYSEPELSALSEGEKSRVFSLKLKDRFGDSGLVGVWVLLFEAGCCKIDTLLLSCRVIGRDIEKWILHHILSECQKRRLSRLIGVYRETPKNLLVKEFYPQNGFKLSGEKDGCQEYAFEIGPKKMKFENSFKKIKIEGVEYEMEKAGIDL